MVLFGFIFVLTCFSLGQSLDVNSSYNQISNLTEKIPTLKVSLYYEALCPYCIEFVVDQLFPAYKLIGPYINVELVPFGNARASNKTGKWVFSCQHGEKECYGNKIQACAIKLNSIPQGVKFVSCAMKSPYPASDTYLIKCSKEVNVSWENIKLCINSGQGDKLLALNGLRTRSVKPRIAYVPTIIFNDRFNTTLDDKAIEAFQEVVCSLLDKKPDVCRNIEHEVDSLNQPQSK